jgi:hypothetical protein
MGIKGVSRLILCISLLGATPGWGAEIHGRSSTQFQSFTNELAEDRRTIDLSEYLRVSITNIDKEGKFSLHGYGRLSQDFTTGEGLNGRLYYLYGDYRDLFGKIDIKVGRQFVNTAAGSAIIDGAQVDLKNVGPVSFTVLGGRDVLFGLNGEIGDGGNTTFGLAALWAPVKRFDAELSWFRKWDGGDVSRDVIGGSLKTYLWDSAKFYTNARYDIVSETFNEWLLGMKVFPTSNLIFTGEFYQSFPTFDTTSIYSVFAVNRYQEGVFRIDWTANDVLSFNAGYNRQDYGEGADADVYHVGVGLRPVEALRINGEWDHRTGYYGDVNGAIVDLTYDLNKASQVAGGISYDVYQRDALTGEETARRYWLGGKYRLSRSMAVSGRVQADVNARFSQNVSGRMTFDYDF